MEIVKIGDIREKLKIIGYSEKKAKEYADIIMDYFGFEDRIVDNILEPQDRKLFYKLELDAILETEREETILCNGKKWRTHYWHLRKENILRPEKVSVHSFIRNPEITCEDIYRGLPEHVWLKKDMPSRETPEIGIT